jgi:hypothetical protein
MCFLLLVKQLAILNDTVIPRPRKAQFFLYKTVNIPDSGGISLTATQTAPAWPEFNQILWLPYAKFGPGHLYFIHDE